MLYLKVRVTVRVLPIRTRACLRLLSYEELARVRAFTQVRVRDEVRG